MWLDVRLHTGFHSLMSCHDPYHCRCVQAPLRGSMQLPGKTDRCIPLVQYLHILIVVVGTTRGHEIPGSDPYCNCRTSHTRYCGDSHGEHSRRAITIFKSGVDHFSLPSTYLVVHKLLISGPKRNLSKPRIGALQPKMSLCRCL